MLAQPLFRMMIYRRPMGRCGGSPPNETGPYSWRPGRPPPACPSQLHCCSLQTQGTSCACVKNTGGGGGWQSGPTWYHSHGTPAGGPQGSAGTGIKNYGREGSQMELSGSEWECGAWKSCVKVQGMAGARQAVVGRGPGASRPSVASRVCQTRRLCCAATRAPQFLGQALQGRGGASMGSTVGRCGAAQSESGHQG